MVQRGLSRKGTARNDEASAGDGLDTDRPHGDGQKGTAWVPTILLFARMHRTRRQRAAAGGKPSPGRPGTPVAAFVLGYLLIWTAYSLAVATGQWALHRALLVSPAMVSVSPLLGGVLLVAAGALQFSRLKRPRDPLELESPGLNSGPG